MRRYYEQTLELKATTTEDKLTIHAGNTLLTYTHTTQHETPWYHLAFDVPQNKLFQARDWLLKRTKLKPRRPGPMSHPDYPDVASFTHWNATSVFFWDPAGNLLEYIARHTLDNDRKGPFTPDDVLHVSEIGLMVDNVKQRAAEISMATNLPDYIGANDHFHPLGDHHALVICFPTNRNWRMPDNTTRPTRPYPTDILLQRPKALEFQLPDHPFTIRA